MNVIGVIPARFQSVRLEGKPLALIGGRPMIQHVYERAAQSSLLTDLLVATDDARIFDAVSGFGGKAVMTSPDHRSGTDRVAEATANIAADVVVNIQGDEPFISPRVIDQLVAPFHGEAGVEMSTLMRPIDNERDLQDPNVVKVVLKLNGNALYFSRSPLPFFRNAVPGLPVLRHKGIYAYSRSFIERFVTWPPSPLERAESLEQLRALENGASIKVLLTNDASPGVDTPEQAREIERILSQQSSLP